MAGPVILVDRRGVARHAWQLDPPPVSRLGVLGAEIAGFVVRGWVPLEVLSWALSVLWPLNPASVPQRLLGVSP